MRSSRIARSLICVGALLLAVLVAGCEEDEPSSSPPASDSPSVPESSSPTEQESTSTPIVSRSPVGTVRAWVAAYNLSFRDGDTTAVDALTTSCATCEELISSVVDVHRDGGYFRGGRWKVDGAAVTDRRPSSTIVTAGITVAAGTTRSSRDEEAKSYPQQRLALEFYVTRQGNPAKVDQIVFLS